MRSKVARHPSSTHYGPSFRLVCTKSGQARLTSIHRRVYRDSGHRFSRKGENMKPIQGSGLRVVFVRLAVLGLCSMAAPVVAQTQTGFEPPDYLGSPDGI